MSVVKKLAMGALGLLALLRRKPRALLAAHVDAQRYIVTSRPLVRRAPRASAPL